MRRPKADRYDYGFSAFGLLFTYAFLAFGIDRGWSTSVLIVSLIVLSIPLGLSLAWFKSRLQSRHRNIP